MPLKHPLLPAEGSAKKFLKTHELMQLTSWSKSTIYRYIEKGVLHPIQLCKGGCYLFSVEEVALLMRHSLT